jgi:hypothetical protein
MRGVAQESFSLPRVPFRVESVLDKAKARSRRLQNSPSAQTVVIADLTLRQALLAKTLSMASQTNALGNRRTDVIPFPTILWNNYQNVFR